jgi:chemotaxis protein CheX
LDDLENSDTQFTPDEARKEVLDAFIVATCSTIAEMAQSLVEVRETYATVTPRFVGDITVVLDLTPGRGAMLVLCFPRPMAAALAERVLAGAGGATDGALVRDCMAEITNIIAGQAKAMLHGTPHRFAFSTPRIFSGQDVSLEQYTGREFLVAHFVSDAGDFTLQVCSADGEAEGG